MSETPPQTVTLELSWAEMFVLNLACDLAVLRAETIRDGLLERPSDRRNAEEAIPPIRHVQAKVKTAPGE